MANGGNYPSGPEAAWAARDAVDALAVADRPALLRAIAAAADAARAEIIATCADETALTPDELAPEFDRMTGTLRMFADLVEEGSWVRAALDTPFESEPPAQAGGVADRPLPVRLIGPNHDLRSMLVPLGPVAVFGASNFPLAYGVLGGDTASALAAGCPVIVKEHPAHPRTGRLLVSTAEHALSRIAWHVKVRPLAYVEDSGADNAVGAALVRHLGVRAVGFTGSKAGGMALDAIGRQRPRPIPVFAEMGSTNRVIVCAGALRTQGPAIARELAGSILSRHGQQCTKPGVILLEHDPVAGPAFIAELARLLDAAAPRRMLSPRILDQYIERCTQVGAIDGITIATKRPRPDALDGAERHAVPMLFAATDHDNARDDLEHFAVELSADGFATLTDEIFGPAAVVMSASGHENIIYADPALVTAIYAAEDDIADLAWRLPLPLASTGRITFNSPTTGVRVATAMVHGGPFPATNVPHTTAVGPRAIERWCRPVCFQNCPDALLPPELQNANPRGILRTVNGIPTRDAIK
jgi:NADP-dependent aldehyde dehydrogenase